MPAPLPGGCVCGETRYEYSSCPYHSTATRKLSTAPPRQPRDPSRTYQARAAYRSLATSSRSKSRACINTAKLGHANTVRYTVCGSVHSTSLSSRAMT
jgi:hypothetical protein